MLTDQQGHAIFRDWPVESPSSSSSNTSSESPLKHERLVDQSCPGCSASQSVANVESDRAGEWFLVQASYIRATWWAYAALLVVFALYWIAVKLCQSIFATGHRPL